MPPVFGHGRLRLYLLKLLGEAPRHGYEVIRMLEERFHGLYAPSAGTVYPRLAKLEAEGLVTHAVAGGRKVYSLTPAGRRELAARGDELTGLEREVRDALAALAAGIRRDISAAAPLVRRGAQQAVRPATPGARSTAAGPADGPAGREARRDGQQAGPGPGETAGPAEQVAQAGQAARRGQERLPPRAAGGRLGAAAREGLAGLGHEDAGLGRCAGQPPAAWPNGAPGPAEPADDPAWELARLLDALRDDVRDAARDHGVTEEQLREARRHLDAAAAHVVALLRADPG